MTEVPEFTINYVQTQEECLEVHRFLCIVARPHLLFPIDAKDSICGVIDVMANGAIVNARINGELIGTIGLVPMAYWYNTSARYIGNRWFFVLPFFNFKGVAVRLEAEAAAIGQNAGMPVCIASHTKRRKTAQPSEPYFMREKQLEQAEEIKPPANRALH